MKKVAILQSNYIPWKGYFDIINMVDEFILYDDMQYTRRDWRNRNKIKTPRGEQWLTIPVEVKGKFFQKINETKVANHDWAHDHWRAIQLNYAKAPYFKKYEPIFADLYEKAAQLEYLSEINHLFMTTICELLGIKTKITWSSDYELVDGKTERLAGLVKSAGGGYYLSGPAAKDYIVDEVFEEAGIELDYMSYEGYPDYPQLYGDFTPSVSVLDLLFMTGEDAPKYMLSFRSRD
ncbi:MAG: WbqC family protein [Lachnospiraceae bacterium]|nr:WbqC family protein [Lachnospiraceae bacterium]